MEYGTALQPTAMVIINLHPNRLMPNFYRTFHLSGITLVIVIISLLFVIPSMADTTRSSIKNRVLGEERLFTIDVKDAQIKDVLRALAEQSDMGIIISSGVEGRVTFTFKDIALRDGLGLMLKAYGYAYTIESGVIWVGKEEDIPKPQDELAVAVIKLNYAEVADITSSLQGLVSSEGSIITDERTNTVIIRESNNRIDEIKTILSTLDEQTTQVIIEARIVEATTSFSQELGIQWGGSYSTAGGSNQITGSQAIGVASGGGRNFAINMPVVAPTSGLGLVVGSLSSNLVLDIELSAAEKDGRARIISRPKITTLNNKTATIHSGVTFRVKTSTSDSTGTSGTSTTSDSGIEEITTGIDLKVTPQITTDGFVLLDITAEKSEADFTKVVDGIPGVSDKTASTFVLVGDGDTTVIAGLYKTSTTSTDTRVPLLGELPLLGWLFKAKSTTEDDEELLIFITPRIVKQLKEVVN
ncbi:MAG: type IV pilus secretin PilQ [Deltaproteobacteria bacterium]|nr:type IV pilus secretin PilQ [Deltaproteobacteria bacterium]